MKETNSIDWRITLRPKTFSEVYGNENTIKALKKQALTKKISNAYLLSGAFGTGKSTIAYILAKAIVCLHPQETGEPCNECSECKAVNDSKFDKATLLINSGKASKQDVIQQIEEFKNDVWNNKRKVVIIEEFQELSTAAKNSLLLDLESPNDGITYIFLTMEKKKISGLSTRLTSFDFLPFNGGQIMLYLKSICERLQIWDSLDKDFKIGCIKYIGEVAHGSLREALNLFQKCYEAEAFTPEQYKALIGAGDNDEVLMWQVVADIVSGTATPKVFDYIKKIENNAVFNDVRLMAKIISDAFCCSAFGKVPSETEYATQQAMILSKNYSKLLYMEEQLSKINSFNASKFDLITFISKVLNYSTSAQIIPPIATTIKSEVVDNSVYKNASSSSSVRRKLLDED
jgi:DNA polymerase-3 subunit gamma/tau